MTEEQEKQLSLADFENPQVWPFWPYQTIKRRRVDGAAPDCALLVDFGPPGLRFDVHFLAAGLFDLEDPAKRKTLLETAKASPAIDPEKLIADGWVID